MARFNALQNSFTGGLISPRLRARNDIEAVAAGLWQSFNGLVLPHGGWMRRPGTVFVAETKNRQALTALIPFDVSTGQQYIMEWGKTGTSTGYVRFFANGGVVESSPGVPYEITNVFDDPHGIRVAQSSDKMWIIHPNVYPYVLTRTGFAAFSLAKATWADGKAPCRPPNTTATTLSYAAGVITASAALFSSGDVGRAVRIEAGGTVSWYEITGYTSTTQVSATLKSGSGAETGALWSLGLFSDTEGCRAVTLHQGRLWFGGSLNVPDWIVGSQSDAFDNFDRGTSTGASPTNGTAEKSIAKRVVSEQLNTVYWIKPFGQLLAVGCSGGEFRVFGSDNDILTPTTTSVRSATDAGSAYIPAMRNDNVALFVQKAARSIYELKYDVLRDQITTRDLMLFAEDVYDPAANGLGGCKRMTFQKVPDRIIWSVKGDGTLVTLTYNPDQKVLATSTHQLGSTASASVAIDVASIQNVAQNADTVWVVADYTINGTTRRYVCYLADWYRPAGINRRSTTDDRIDALNTAYFVDAGLDTTLGSPASSVSGLSHLAGMTVSVLIDGKVHPDVVVSGGGSITTNFSGTHFVVGLPYTSRAETARFVGGAKIGTDFTFPAKIARVGLVLQNSLGGYVGTGNGLTRELSPIGYPTAGSTMDNSPPLFTGEVELSVEQAWRDEPTVYWETMQPLPLTVLAVVPRAKLGEG